jgi:hypothetical protein
MAFATVALAELAFVFSLRSPIPAAWEAPRNMYLVGSVVLSAALVATAYVPALNAPLGTVTLGAQELGIVVRLSLVPFLCVEAGKGLFHRVGWTLDGAQA